jgi:hypothetical protein
MNVGLVELVVLAVFVGFPVWGIIDAANRPRNDWDRAHQSKVLWIVLQVVFGAFGAAIYFAAVRPKLARVAS